MQLPSCTNFYLFVLKSIHKARRCKAQKPTFYPYLKNRNSKFKSSLMTVVFQGTSMMLLWCFLVFWKKRPFLINSLFCIKTFQKWSWESYGFLWKFILFCNVMPCDLRWYLALRANLRTACRNSTKFLLIFRHSWFSIICSKLTFLCLPRISEYYGGIWRPK